MENLFHKEIQIVRKTWERKALIWANSLHSKNVFFFVPPGSSDRSFFPFNKFQCFKTLTQEGQRKECIYMAISFHTTCSVQTFLKLGFFLLSYTLLTLRFWDKICLTLSICQLTANHPGQVQEPYKQFFLMSLCYHTCLYHFLPGTKLPASRKNSWGECFYTKDFPPSFSPIQRIWQYADDTVRA